MAQICKKIGLKWGLLASTTLLSFNVMAQNSVVRGIVTDDMGQPVVGATIMVEGTTRGTVSNMDGTYEIKVNDNESIVISYLGMNDFSAAVSGRSNIDVKLQSQNTELDEVIVVGYGTQKKADLTGAVSQVTGEKLATAQTPSLQQNLTGKLTGVQVSQYSGSAGFEDSQIYIRGQATQNGSSPLVLVDGVERDWNRLDPSEIASMTVLKDAASTAIYGARAANGVILITTKRGKEGKTTIEYNGSVGVQRATDLWDTLDAADYMHYWNIAKLATVDGDASKVTLYTDEEIAAFRNGEKQSTNWLDETFTRSPMIQNHSVSMSGGKNGTNYFASAGYMDQKGLYELSEFSRYNARVNVDSQLSDYIKVSADLSTRSEDATRSGWHENNIWQKALGSLPMYPSELPEGVDPDGYAYGGLQDTPIGLTQGSGYENYKKTYVQSDFKVDVDIPWVEGLKAGGRFSYDKTFIHEKHFTTPYNQYRENAEGGWDGPIAGAAGDPSLDEEQRNYSKTMLQASLAYSKKFNEKHNLDVLALFEREQGDNYSLEAGRTGFVSTDVDYMFAGELAAVTNGGGAGEWAREGYVGRINYNYDNKYYVQVNGRYDGSYKFAPGSRFGFFPSVSGAWRLSEENFLKDVEWLDQFKIRGSYGVVGNDNLSAFQYLGLYGFDTDAAAGFITGEGYNTAISESVAANQDVTWESTATSNIGFDLTVLKGKLSFEFDHFRKHTTDMLISNTAGVPASSGISLPKVNAGEVMVKGYEFLTRYNDKFGKVDFNADFNVTYAKDEIVDIGESDAAFEPTKREGRSIGQTFGYESAGLFQSQDEIDSYGLDQDGKKNASIRPGDIKFVDQNGDGKLNEEDQVAIGKPLMPQLVFGLNLNASWKNLSLTANFQGAGLMSRRNTTCDDPFGLDMNTIYDLVNDTWTETNTDAKYPRLYHGGSPNNNMTSDFFLDDVWYVRLKNLELAYTLPSHLLSGTGIGYMRVYVAGTNLLTMTNSKYQDPEVVARYSNSSFTPPMQTFTLGVNLSF